MQEGWVCPKCGTVNAPWKDKCDCTNIEKLKSPQYPQYPKYEVGDYFDGFDYGGKVTS